LNALNSVLTAQNQMITIWVNYESFRLDMYNFMGTMEIDEYGFWVDEFYQKRALAARAGRDPESPPPQAPAPLAPQHMPQDSKDASVDATPKNLHPQPANSRSRPPKRDANLQVVKGESWPERTVIEPAGGRGKTADRGGSAGRNGRGSSGVEDPA